MLVSLKVLPLSSNPDGFTLQLTSNGAVGVWPLSLQELYRRMLAQQPLTIVLQVPEPPLPNAKRIKRSTMKQEEQVARDLGGHRQRGSGSISGKKGDGWVRGKYKIENKKKIRRKSITIKRMELDKIRAECAPGEQPLFQFEFANPGTLAVEDRWIMVPYEHWKQVCGETSDDQ